MKNDPFKIISNWFESILKGNPTSSNVHVNSPLGSEDDECYRIAKAAIDAGELAAPVVSNLEATMLNAAFGGAPLGSATGDTPQAAAKPGDDKSSTPPAKGGKLKPDGQNPAKDGDSGTPGKAKPPVKKSAQRRVATVAVIHKDKILMGKRRDNGKWTFPGGHLNEGEDFLTGAKRELQEETGIGDAEHMEELMPVQKVADDLHVQPYIVKFSSRPQTSMMDDPDGEVERWRWFDFTEGLPSEIHKNLHVPAERNCLLQALNLVNAPEKRQGNSANSEEPIRKSSDDIGQGTDGDNDETGLYSLQEIISGIDYELEVNKLTDENDARDAAMENLQDDPNFYALKWAEVNGTSDEIEKDTEQTTESPTAGMGFNLDLGSGQAREPGHIGLDLYPYDYGTLIHDLNQGIPFPDESAKNVRMVNSLHHMDGLSEDPKPLLSEIERVLMPGGQFHYEGPNEIENYPEWLDPQEHEEAGTVAKEDGGTPEGNPTWVKQKFTRLAKPDPATANDAEPRIGVSQEDQLPADALLAMDAVGYYNADASSSGRGNRLHGYPSQGALVQKNSKDGSSKTKALYLGDRVPIMKMNTAKQIVYGVVISPNESDLQEDIMSPEDIESTAHNYLVNSRAVGSGHEKQITAYPVESYIAPQDMEWEDGQYGPQKIVKGAWVLGVKIVDKKEWQKVVNGDYTGFSVGGFGLRDPLT